MRKSTFTPGYLQLRESLIGARQEAGFSQRDLAKLLDVPPSVVAKIETGERRIDPVELCWICTACGTDPSPILSQVSKSAGSPIEDTDGLDGAGR